MTTSVTFAPFGNTLGSSGEEVQKITISNGTLVATFTNYGASLLSLLAPDRNGKQEEITLCYKTLEELQTGSYFYGVSVV
jgi:aldose 1-epimerase